MRVLALLAIALLVAGETHAEPDPGADPEAAPGYEFAFTIAGGWWSDSVQNRSDAIRPIPPPPGACGLFLPDLCARSYSLRVGPQRVSDSTQPHGGSVQVAVRVFAPPRVRGGRPWLELGYRQPIAGRAPRTGDAWLRVEHERSALVTAGIEWRVIDAPIALQVSPYAGVELGWFEAELEPGLLVPDDVFQLVRGDQRRDLRIGTLLGLELATPLVTRDRFRLEATIAGDAALWLGGRRSLGDSGPTSFFVPPRAETEPRWSGSVRIGLRLRL